MFSAFLYVASFYDFFQQLTSGLTTGGSSYKIMRAGSREWYGECGAGTYNRDLGARAWGQSSQRGPGTDKA